MKVSLPFKYITAVKGGKQYVVFDYKDCTGKRKRKWIGTDLPEKCTKKALSEKLEEIVSEFYEDYLKGDIKKVKKGSNKSSTTDKTSTEDDPKNYGFTHFLNVWLETIKPTIAETTYISYKHKLSTIIKYFDKEFPDIKLVDTTAMEIQKFYNDMYSKGMTANTVKHYHANIHKALKYALKMNLVDCNESEKTERPKLEKYEATYYKADELEHLFRAFRGDRMEIVVLIAAFYGMRRSEVIGLKWDAVDFNQNTLTIREKAYNVYEDGKLVVKFQNQLKNKASYRTLPLIPYIAELLKAKKENNKYLAKALKTEYNHEYDEYICTDDVGDLITPNYVSDHFANMIEKHKLKKIRLHDLRHSCASLLLANGIQMKAIQEWLGHSTFQVTADFYSHLDFHSKIDSANKIADVLSGKDKKKPLNLRKNQNQKRPVRSERGDFHLVEKN